MPDTIGNITVPEIVPSGTFPIVPDYPHGRAWRPEVVVHQFGSGNAKIEQRFLLGTGAKRFTVRRAFLRDADRLALRNFFESKYGAYGAFTYNAPNDDGVGTTAYTCRFANEPLGWEMVADHACSVGVTLVEIPTTSPTYPLNQTVTRFPTEALKTALLSQVQRIIPLIRIVPLQAGYPAIYLSDRRCTIGTQLYQARLLEFDGISQGMGNEADEATFTFGNADRIMRDLANDVDLYRAAIEFSLFHVGTGIKLDLWKGEIINWSLDAGPEFRVTAADGLYELNLPYPCRKISRSCWKTFNSQACPYSTVGALDLVHFPGADATKCDKGYETANGCLAHGMKRYFGAVLVDPQGVRVKDNSTGTWGFSRSMLTSVSLVAESIYDQVVPDLHGRRDAGQLQDRGGSGRGRLLRRLGHRGRRSHRRVHGAAHGGPRWRRQSRKARRPHHRRPGAPGFPGDLGLRGFKGEDPPGASDRFSLDESGNTIASKPADRQWRYAFEGASTYLDNYAAGTAFVVVRRADAKGLQLSRLGEHQIQAVVQQGMSGWVWTSPGVRVFGPPLTNPVWIVINMLLRARGIRLGANATTQQLDLAETFFDAEAAIEAATICNNSVSKLVGSGSETQFKFRGVLQEEKPLRDWIQEVLMNCLGHYTFSFGKLKIGVRVNSSVIEPFTEGNVLFRSLQLAPLKPSFNHLTANFADEEFDFVKQQRHGLRRRSCRVRGRGRGTAVPEIERQPGRDGIEVAGGADCIRADAGGAGRHHARRMEKGATDTVQDHGARVELGAGRGVLDDAPGHAGGIGRVSCDVLASEPRLLDRHSGAQHDRQHVRSGVRPETRRRSRAASARGDPVRHRSSGRADRDVESRRVRHVRAGRLAGAAGRLGQHEYRRRARDRACALLRGRTGNRLVGQPRRDAR
jgi:hypothetical protein